MDSSTFELVTYTRSSTVKETAFVIIELGLIVRWRILPMPWSHILDHLQSKIIFCDYRIRTQRLVYQKSKGNLLNNYENAKLAKLRGGRLEGVLPAKA